MRCLAAALLLAVLPRSGGQHSSPFPAPSDASRKVCFSTASATSAEPVSFVALDGQVQRQSSPGSPDFVLEHASGIPKVSQLHAPTADSDANELFADLTALHSRKSLRLSDVLIVHGLLEYGVSSTIHALVYHVLLAYIDGKTLMAPQLELWANSAFGEAEACIFRDMSCYFDSMPSLGRFRMDAELGLVHLNDTAADGKDAQGNAAPPEVKLPFEVVPFEVVPFERKSKVVPFERKSKRSKNLALLPEVADPSLQQTWDVLTRLDENSTSESVCALVGHHGVGCPTIIQITSDYFWSFDETPMLFRLPHKLLRHGRFWLVSQVLKWLTGPNAVLRQRTDQKRSEIGLKPPYLSLHVRKGDACTHRGDCRGLKEAMQEVELLTGRYELRSILLSTPDESVIAEIPSFPEYNFTTTGVTNTTAILKSHGMKRIEEGLDFRVFSAVEEFRAFMVDIYLLSEGDVFVGGFTSNAARLTYSLMTSGPNGCLKPFQSLDINWCYGFLRGGLALIRYGNMSVHDVVQNESNVALRPTLRNVLRSQLEMGC